MKCQSRSTKKRQQEGKKSISCRNNTTDNMATPVELLGILEALVEAEFKKFKWLLHQTDVLEGFPVIPKSLLENADRIDTVDLIMYNYNQNVVEVTIKVLKKFNKQDLVQRLLSVSSMSKESVSHCQRKLKLNFRKRLQPFLNSSSNGKQMFLSGLYTELRVSGHHSGKADINQARFQYISKGHLKNSFDNFFNLQNFQEKVYRTLLTKGISGSGKTALTQKVILDWTEDKINDTIQFVFPISFKELNLIKNKKYCLVELLHYFFPETKEAGIFSFEALEILFIFDGLNNCQLSLDFDNNDPLNDITESAEVDVLLTNLIMRRLLPSAHLWITTTPEAVENIPSNYIDTVTEVERFTDSKRDEYLRRRFRNKELSSTIISHIKSSRRLSTWCSIPLHCHICAVVLEDELKDSDKLNTPKTLTEMYTRFFVIQSKLATANGISDSSSAIMSLAKLAFKQLHKNNQIISEEDLMERGIDVQTVSSYSEVFTEVFSGDCGNQNKLYSFAQSSFQVFLAAVQVTGIFINSGINLLFQDQQTSPSSVQNFYERAVHLVLQSPGGPMQLFLRFLFGLSLQTNESLLKDWLKLSGGSLGNKEGTVQHIQKQLLENPPPNQCINLLHCLNELNVSVVEEIQHYLTSCTYDMSPAHISDLVFILLTSESCLEEFDLRKYSRNTYDDDEQIFSLIQVSKRCVLRGCILSERNHRSLASALSLGNLKELDLSYNDLTHGIVYLTSGMKTPQCQLEILRLIRCDLSQYIVQQLSSILSCESSCLKELDLSGNSSDNTWIEGLVQEMQSPHCKLKTLRLTGCSLTWLYCDSFAHYLSSPYSTLTELELSLNKVQDEGVMVLSTALKSPQCKVETVRLSGCGLTDKGCDVLASVVSESCSLSRLDLSRNSVCDSGVRLLSRGMKVPGCRLTSLSLRECQLSAESCEELGSALSSHMCELKELDLSSNDLQDSGVQLLCVGLQSPQCRLETLRLSGCMVTEKGCASLASALSSNPSHLIELDLSYNHPGETGVRLLSPALEDPLWKLHTLCFDQSGAHRMKPSFWKYACELTLDPNTTHRDLILSENNRKVKCVNIPQPYPYHPDRFEVCEQVMCSSGLTGRCYWEVKCEGNIDIAVSYRGFHRRRHNGCHFGSQINSWCFSWNYGNYLEFRHYNRVAKIDKVQKSDRLAVFLDWEAGTLSLYSVASGTLTHLYTMYSTFTEPLYPGFRLSNGGQVSFCQSAEELDDMINKD